MAELLYGLKKRMMNTRLDILITKQAAGKWKVEICEDTGSYSMDDPFYYEVAKDVKTYTAASEIARDVFDYMAFHSFGCMRHKKGGA